MILKDCGKTYSRKFAILIIVKCPYSSLALITFTWLGNHYRHPLLEFKTELYILQNKNSVPVKQELPAPASCDT